MFKKLQESFDLNRLQRAEARRKSKSQLGSSKKRSVDHDAVVPVEAPRKKAKNQNEQEELNKLDPIMLMPVGKKNTWKFIRPNGNRTRY